MTFVLLVCAHGQEVNKPRLSKERRGLSAIRLLFHTMGQVESVPSCQELIRNEQGDFVVVSNSLPDDFQFEPSESQVIAYGIDQQSDPKFKKKSLTFITVDDAKQVLNAFVRVKAVWSDNAHLFSASGNPQCCTADGMRKTFQHSASKVGPEGLFVFHFSGHGIKVREEMWGLAPMDFDYSSSTYITADVLCQWLNDIKCRAKYILITLDCCYAGGIGEELTAQADVERNENLFVLSACTANETSLVLASLGHSIFTYFLSCFIAKFSTGTGVLPMKKIFSECRTCCECLSSMLVSYSRESGELQMKLMQPQMSVRNIVSDGGGEDSVDSAAVPINRFQFVQELYNSSKRIAPLHDKSMAYLDSVKDPTGPLVELERRGLLQGRVVVSVFCSMMYSIASIELACDNTGTKVKNVNLSITAFMNAASAIDMVYQGVQCDGYTFLLSWLFYKEVMRKNMVEVAGMGALEAKLKESYVTGPRKVTRLTVSQDMTDSNEEDILVS